MRGSKKWLTILAGGILLACSTAESTVDDMVYKMVQAQGGADALAKVEDQVSTWDSKMTMPMGEEMTTVESEMVITYKRPNKIKFEAKMPDGSVMFSSVFDGTNGWQDMGEMMGGVREMSQAELEETILLAETWIDGWHNYAEKGFTLTMMPDITMDGKTYHVIKAVDRFGNESMNYCNPANAMVERTDSKMFDAMKGEKVAGTMTFTNYAPHGGFMMPQNVAYTSEASGSWEMTLKEMKINVGVSDDTFAKPGESM